MMYSIETKSNQRPELTQYIIKNESQGLKAVFLPNLGATLQYYAVQNIEIIDGISLDSNGLNSYKSSFNSAILFPFFGRIPQGRYQYKNKSYQFECNVPDSSVALHGHLYNQKFEQTHVALTDKKAKIIFEYQNTNAQQEYPFPYKLSIEYLFSKNQLGITINLENIGNTALPFGLGWHPYFKTASLSDSYLNFQAKKQVQFNKDLLPAGEIELEERPPIKVGSKALDNGFILNKSNFEFTTPEYTMYMEFSSLPPNSYLQAYTPDHRKSIALEPLTCVPNCLNNGIGLQELNPEDDYVWRMQLNFQQDKKKG